ncbi:MAG: cytidine deaminase [Candidatus Gastranaerophilales bacterium]|nr:cytidine deaminase [Candidatus Gastranaerophilales bacterium]
MLNKTQQQKLLLLASKASECAYAPYSKFRVGAVVLFDDGSTYKGCNVENASYGLSICAERNAISTAVADGKNSGIVAVAISSPDSKLCYPCGACRQWISEFSKDAMIIVENEDRTPLVHTILELLPHTFRL